MAPGQPTCEGGRAGCTPRYLAFLASAAGAALQQQLLLRSPTVATADAAVSLVSNVWFSAHNSPCHTGLAAYSQSAWDRPVITAERQQLMNSLSNAGDQARLLAVTSPHSSDWLHALPLSGCGLRLDDHAVHIAVGLRLGANICEPHQCPCGATVDAKGLHVLSCRGGTGRSVVVCGYSECISCRIVIVVTVVSHRCDLVPSSSTAENGFRC